MAAFDEKVAKRESDPSGEEFSDPSSEENLMMVCEILYE